MLFSLVYVRKGCYNAVMDIKLYKGADYIIRELRKAEKETSGSVGKGAYFTSDYVSSAEFACRNGRSGYVSTFDFEDKSLNILDLSDPEKPESILQWISLLCDNRIIAHVGSFGEEIMAELKERYSVDVTQYDVIITPVSFGQIFTSAEQFIKGDVKIGKVLSEISARKDSREICLRTNRAFNRVKFSDGALCDLTKFYGKICQGTEAVLMDHLGSMLDSARFDFGVEPEQFWEQFLSSGVSDLVSSGNKFYVFGMSGAELAKLVLRKTDADVSGVRFSNPDLLSREYWVGWAMAAYMFRCRRSFAEINSMLPLRDVMDMYQDHSDSDVDAFCQAAESVYVKRAGNKLAALRKQSGLTQKDLAEKSGIELRTIRAYEQDAKKLNKAQVNTLIALAGALGCRYDELIKGLNDL